MRHGTGWQVDPWSERRDSPHRDESLGGRFFCANKSFFDVCVFLENNAQQNHNDNGAPQTEGRRCRCDFVAHGFHSKYKEQKRPRQKNDHNNGLGRGVVGLQVAGAKNYITKKHCTKKQAATHLGNPVLTVYLGLGVDAF